GAGLHGGAAEYFAVDGFADAKGRLCYQSLRKPGSSRREKKSLEPPCPCGPPAAWIPEPWAHRRLRVRQTAALARARRTDQPPPEPDGCRNRHGRDTRNNPPH